MAAGGSSFNPRIFRSKRMSAGLPPATNFATGHGVASPPGTALWGPPGCGSPRPGHNNGRPGTKRSCSAQQPSRESNGPSPSSAATGPPQLPPPRGTAHTARPLQHSQPLPAPLGSGSPPGNHVAMDQGTSPCGLDISLATDIPMEEDTGQGLVISLATDVYMEEDTGQ